MTRLEHQKKLINDQLKKYLTILQDNTTRSRDFLIDHAERYKMPKMLTRKNIKRYNQILKAATLIKQNLEK